MAGQRRLPERPGNPYRLGRSVHHDERSRLYAVRVPAGADLDVPVEWPAPAGFGVLDQGGLGSCVGNAATACAAFTGQWTADPTTGAALDEPYAVGLYSAATALDPWDGQWEPDDTGTDGLSAAKALKARGLLVGYRHAFSFDAARAAILDGPFITGTTWWSGMFDPNPSSGVVSISGEQAGGHEYLVRGRQQYFGVDNGWWWLCRNSWGPGWGPIGGDFLLSDDTYRTLLADDGDVTVLDFADFTPADPPPAPPAPAAPTWLDRLILWILNLIGTKG